MIPDSPISILPNAAAALPTDFSTAAIALVGATANIGPIPNAIKTVSEKLLNDRLMNCAIIDFLKKDRPRIKNNMAGDIIKSKENFLP